MRKILLFFLVLVTLTSCSRWKVSEMKGKRLFAIPSGAGVGSVSLQFGEGDLLDLSFVIKMSNDKIYCADNNMKRLQVFDNDGSPLLVISGEKAESSSFFTKQGEFAFGTIGEIISDAEDNIYVQNRLQGGEGGITTDLDITPSYILVFDKSGKLQYTLGQRGPADLPFYYIESLFVDKEDRLFVFSKTFETWTVSRYKGKARDFSANFSKEMFKIDDKKEKYNGVIENIRPFKSGEKLLVSVAYYSKTRFKFRKIYEYKVGESSVSNVVLELPDPKNELFSIMDDKYILLWNVDGRDIKFALWSFQGNIINNLRIRMDKKKGYFEQVGVDPKGHFYTYVVRKDGIEIMEWE